MPAAPRLVRRLGPVVLIAVLVTACSTRSDRVTAPVELPTALSTADPGTSSCRVTIGQGSGAQITETIPGTAGAETFQPNEIILSFGGAPIVTSSDLVRSVRSRSVGETVEVIVQETDGNQASRTLTLRENPEAAGSPLLGVLVTTLEDQRAVDEIDIGTMEGPLVRVVALEGSLWLFDSGELTWRSLGIAEPSSPWVSVGGEIYSFLVDDAGALQLQALRSGTTIAVDLGEWALENLITTIGTSLLVGVTRPDPANAEVTQAAVLAVDPSLGIPQWVWVPDQSQPETVPAFGFRSLDGGQVALSITEPEDLTASRYVVLREVEGRPEGTLLDVIPEGFVALGWHDANTLAGIVTSIDELVLVDLTTGDQATASVSLGAVPIGLWPAGDGAHLIVEDGTALQQLEVGDIGRRSLTEGCTSTIVGDLGWSV